MEESASWRTTFLGAQNYRPFTCTNGVRHRMLGKTFTCPGYRLPSIHCIQNTFIICLILIHLSLLLFRVCVNPYDFCGTCHYCTRGHPQFCIKEAMRTALGYQRNGGFQQYCLVPSHLVHPLPATMTLQQAVFCQPLSTIVRGWDNMGKIESDANILIAGAGNNVLIFMMNILKMRFSTKYLSVLEGNSFWS